MEPQITAAATPPPTLPIVVPGRFAAIDFETADDGRDSACAVGLIVVDGLKVSRKAHFLIRPPRRSIRFSYIHGITWKHVENEPLFAAVWPEAAKLLDGIEFLAAHNAPFDRGVLTACCQVAGLPAPPAPFRCTVQLARKTWGLKSNRLPDVARHLGIPLTHHHAESDALACAGIVIAARMKALTAGASPR